MVKRIILALLVGVGAALLTHLVGLALKELLGLENLGSFIVAIDGIVGFLVGLWWFLTNNTPRVY